MTAWFRRGVYYLPETLVLGAADSGTQAAPVTYAAYPGEEVVLSGGVKLQLEWTPFRDGILMARVPAALDTDQLFVNGRRQILARYPNYDAASQYFNGWSPDAFSKERAAGWKDPRGGFLHAMHRSMWGDFHYRITGKDAAGNLTYEGGWQNNRPMGMHDKYRFVENVFEELDAPGEWFLDRAAHVLYFYPPPGIDLSRATVEAVRLRHLVELRGSEAQPVQWITLRGFTFRHAARTFMETREPLLRSDWTIYRGGALFLTGAADCAIEECIVDQVGGNAIFVSGFNRRVAVRRAHVVAPGATAVAFVGEASAVRSPLFEVNRHQALSELDPVPGPRSNTYPADCLLEDSLLHEIGRVEKQTAGVEISMAQGITVRRCSIYDAPRAGINISEGTWGGHLIEFCDVFDTVKETGDHGAFNSWGRDRYWQATGIDLNALGTGALHELPVLDAVKPTTLRNNRWRCDHGWDIDLDDGSTNYRIENNLALNGGHQAARGLLSHRAEQHHGAQFLSSARVVPAQPGCLPPQHRLHRLQAYPGAEALGRRGGFQPAAVGGRYRGSQRGRSTESERTGPALSRSRRTVCESGWGRLPRSSRLARADAWLPEFCHGSVRRAVAEVEKHRAHAGVAAFRGLRSRDSRNEAGCAHCPLARRDRT